MGCARARYRPSLRPLRHRSAQSHPSNNFRSLHQPPSTYEKMSFLFKSKQRTPNPNALPNASRDVRSSDGTPNSSSSQIPTLNGMVNGATAKPSSSSPTPGTSVNNSLSSLQGNEQQQPTSRPGTSNNTRPSTDEKPHAAYMNDRGTQSPAPPSPEQKSIRSGMSDQVRLVVTMRERCVSMGLIDKCFSLVQGWLRSHALRTLLHTHGRCAH